MVKCKTVCLSKKQGCRNMVSTEKLCNKRSIGLKNKKHSLHKYVCAFMALLIVGQVSATSVYAMETGLQSEIAVAAEKGAESLVEALSQNGNAVTQYVNEEDQKLKTIVWAKGITPPKMGGPDSDFVKEKTYLNGKLEYVEYKAPYIADKGWYDVNKTENRDPDKNLCFAAAASNTLHWWMDQNAAYIDAYLAAHPEYKKAEELKKLRNSFKSQQDSEVYKLFVRQFANKPDGYWPDILQDQFINGYYPKPNGGTNDSEADRDKLIKDGPDPKGGFFYDVFGVNRLTQRRWYDFGYDAISNEIKQWFVDGDMVLLTYDMGAIAHVVTLWGAEFDTDGKISGVYLTDSDDDQKQGMLRYNLINNGGRAVVGTSLSGKGSKVTSLQTLSLGKKIWEDTLHIAPKTLELEWSDTQLTYNGLPQKPSVTATNIADGDEIILSVQGEQTNAGTYTATVILSGAAAEKYRLPENATKEFVIHKAPAPQIVFPTAKELTYGQKLNKSDLLGGSTQYGTFAWKDGDIVPIVENAGYPVLFTPNPVAFENYELPTQTQQIVLVPVQKAVSTLTVTADIKKLEDARQVLLTAHTTAIAQGEIPTGTVQFIAATENMTQTVIGESAFEKDGSAKFVWNQPEDALYQIKAVYKGNENYAAAESDEIIVDMQKLSQKDFDIVPIAEKTYGDAAFELGTIGGNGNGLVTFASDDPNIVSIMGNTATIHKAGTVVITATKQGDVDYNEAKASFPLTIGKKTATIVADDKLDVKKGEPMPKFTYTVEGLVSGDTIAHEPSFTVQTENTNVVGQYAIVPSGAVLTNADSYTIIYKAGILDIVDVPEEILPQPTVKPVPTPIPETQPTATPKPQPTETPAEDMTPQNTPNPETMHPAPNETVNQSVVASPVQKPAQSNKNHNVQKVDAANPTATPQDVWVDDAESATSADSGDVQATVLPTESPEKETTAAVTTKTHKWTVFAVLGIVALLLALAIIVWRYMKKHEKSEDQK